MLRCRGEKDMSSYKPGTAVQSDERDLACQCGYHLKIS